jgi:hypothetical protein
MYLYKTHFAWIHHRYCNTEEIPKTDNYNVKIVEFVTETITYVGVIFIPETKKYVVEAKQ